VGKFHWSLRYVPTNVGATQRPGKDQIIVLT
jgi:hypothetical protein